MPEPAWVRVRKPGVGTWSQREDAPLVEGAVLVDEHALDPAGRVVPDVPEQPDAALEAATTTSSGDEQPERDGEEGGEQGAPDGTTESPDAGTAEATETRRR